MLSRSAGRTLAALTVAALLALAMLRLGAVATAGGGGAWDRAILLWLRGRLPAGPLVALTQLGSGTVLTLAVAVAAGAMLVVRAWRHAALLVVASASGGWLVDLLKHRFARPRPSLVDHLVPVSSPSFPSAHAANSAIVLLTIGALSARILGGGPRGRYAMAVAVLLTVGIGASRVALGVHWPSDVVGGWGIGAAWALMWWSAAEHTLPPHVGKTRAFP